MRSAHATCICLVASSLLLLPVVSSAQSTLRVLRSAVVVADPKGDADVVGTVLAGEILELLDERGSWYLVRPPDDGSEREWRTGWLKQGMVEHRDAGAFSRRSADSVNAGRKLLKGMALLAPGHRVYVRPVPKKDTHEVVGNLLRDWGRWRVVDARGDAELILRLKLSGSAGWGRASIVATLEEAATATELWRSKKQTGNRTIFHGYASPYNRAAEGILKQLEKASSEWPEG